MKTLTLLILMVILPISSFGQGTSGISIGGGYSTEANLTLSASYFHPVLMKQLYLAGGFSSFNVGQSVGVTDDIYNLYFVTVNQVFVGIRLGDYLFASPKLSYNWYGKHKSVGWGFAGGLLLHPVDQFSFGFFIGHDQIRFDSSLDRYGPTSITSFSAVVNFHIVN